MDLETRAIHVRRSARSSPRCRLDASEGRVGPRKPKVTRRALGIILAGVVACSCDGVTDPGYVIDIVRQPVEAALNAPLNPGIEVLIRNASGTPVSGTVTIAIDPNECEWPLGGTASVEAIGGQAFFEDLSFAQVAPGYRLAVTYGTARAFTEPIDVLPFDLPGQLLTLENSLCPKPNPQRDAESLTYSPHSDSFWLADDDNPSIFEVDRETGRYLSQVPASSFLAAFPELADCDDGDGDPLTSCSYVNELEHVAYDEHSGTLYVMNTVNSSVPPGSAQPDRAALFKLRSGGAACPSCWTFVSWRELPGSFAAMVTIEGALYLAVASSLYGYDYEANRVLTTDENGGSLPPALVAANNIRRLEHDGTYLWVILSPLAVHKIEWRTQTLVASYDLGPSGIEDPRGIEVVGDRLYVLDGERPNPIIVFTVSTAP